MTMIGEEERKRIIWMFSTHPSLGESNGRVVWIYDRKLKTNITTLCQSEPNANAEYLARWFLNNISQPLARRHLVAYLEKIGYRAANNVYKQLSKSPNGEQLRYYRGDIYQIAWSFSSDPDTFFRTFNSQHSLENYAYKKMEGKVKDEIVGNLGMSKRRSGWGLLRYSSRENLIEALQNQGYSQSHIECYLLVWNSFRRIYADQRATNNGSLPAPTDEQFQQMENLYNQLVQSSAQVADFSQANQVTIKAMLERCIEALRTYQPKPVVSLDSPTGKDENSDPLSETIRDEQFEFQWEQMESQEFIPDLMAHLKELLTPIDEYTNNCLLLRYGFELDYRSIAPIFEIYYTTVRRRDNNATQELLTQVAQWARENLNVTPDSEILNEMHAQLKECLKKYYKEFIFESVFKNAWQQLDCQYQNILYLHYFRQIDVSAIAHQLQLDKSAVSKQLVIGRQDLAAAITQSIQSRLNIPPHLLDPLADKIVTFVQTLIAYFATHNFI